ncbi:ATP-binding protein [uncultured Draconibacterium sp.]|uniref:ATP-binding response regulator n=1 Tax=uncultured Draconibacterium sp. TaxID=1573823 RepID=UPI0029C06908|nr:ATP-binding protein [uncultured Draconibacterium sp.]
MLNTVNDIVEISKIEAGLAIVKKELIFVNERIEELVRFFTPEAQKKGIQLVVKELLPISEHKLLTDRNKMDSILTNLIKNAIKYTESGDITIGCHLIGSEAEFYVKDTGIGIPTNRKEAIFNRFEQADIEDTRGFEGSGLGLAICKSYVEMLGGRIWVESEEGLGSTFYFTMPVAGKSDEKSINDNKIFLNYKNMKSITNKLKILIAEDDKISRKYLTLLINGYADEILEAENGIKAVEVCRANTDIDLILMDIQMPEMNGYEATREIRKFNKDVIIIAQTAFALFGDREKVLDAGCNDYISKPIEKEVLRRKIQKILKGLNVCRSEVKKI